MKKVLSIILLLVMVPTFTACSQQAKINNNNKFDISSKEWVMNTIQSQETENNGMIVAYGKSDNATEHAKKIDMVFKAEKGQFTLNDQTNNKTYSGEYTVKSSSANSTIYDISIGNTKGMAVVSYTKYNDDSQVDTLILSFKDYALNFTTSNN